MLGLRLPELEDDEPTSSSSPPSSPGRKSIDKGDSLESAPDKVQVYRLGLHLLMIIPFQYFQPTALPSSIAMQDLDAMLEDSVLLIGWETDWSFRGLAIITQFLQGFIAKVNAVLHTFRRDHRQGAWHALFKLLGALEKMCGWRVDTETNTLHRPEVPKDPKKPQKTNQTSPPAPSAPSSPLSPSASFSLPLPVLTRDTSGDKTSGPRMSYDRVKSTPGAPRRTLKHHHSPKQRSSLTTKRVSALLERPSSSSSSEPILVPLLQPPFLAKVIEMIENLKLNEIDEVFTFGLSKGDIDKVKKHQKEGLAFLDFFKEVSNKFIMDAPRFPPSLMADVQDEPRRPRQRATARGSPRPLHPSPPTPTSPKTPTSAASSPTSTSSLTVIPTPSPTEPPFLTSAVSFPPVTP